MRNARLYWMILDASLLVGAASLGAAEKRGLATDQIEVIAHYPLSGGPVNQLATATHWQKNYLYVDQGAAGPVTILDVTNATAPTAAGELDIPKQEASGNLTPVVGTAALIASSASVPTQPKDEANSDNPELRRPTTSNRGTSVLRGYINAERHVARSDLFGQLRWPLDASSASGNRHAAGETVRATNPVRSLAILCAEGDRSDRICLFARPVLV